MLVGKTELTQLQFDEGVRGVLVAKMERLTQVTRRRPMAFIAGLEKMGAQIRACTPGEVVAIARLDPAGKDYQMPAVFPRFALNKFDAPAMVIKNVFLAEPIDRSRLLHICEAPGVSAGFANDMPLMLLGYW
ncbi:hypothetical protein [Kocuria marina]|uniref:hypothetical protein n=1 Tax=Kocuria marina TaxID=223184 RepID=UPI0022DEA4EA|nr:hypothetical protein [Kocuria marina]